MNRLLALVLAALTALLGLPPGTTTTTAATYSYDASTSARVDAHELEPAAASPAQLSDLPEGSASPSAAARGTSTTPLALDNATNTVGGVDTGMVHGPIKPGEVPISVQQQAGHIPGTPQYANRLKVNKPTSAWDPQ